MHRATPPARSWSTVAGPAAILCSTSSWPLATPGGSQRVVRKKTAHKEAAKKGGHRRGQKSRNHGKYMEILSMQLEYLLLLLLSILLVLLLLSVLLLLLLVLRLLLLLLLLLLLFLLT